MIARYERPISAAALFARRISGLALALFAAVVVAHRFGSLSISNAVLCAGVAAVLALLALLLAIIGFCRLWKVGAQAGWASLTALVCASIVLVPSGYAVWLHETSPAVRDVTSNPDHAPEWLVAPRLDRQWLPTAVGSLASQRALQKEAWPELAGRRYRGAMDRVLQAVQMATHDEGMKVVAETGAAAFAHPDKTATPMPAAPSASGGAVPGSVPIPLARPSAVLAEAPPPIPDHVSIQAIHRSTVFGLTSDVLVQLREEGGTTVVDMRVASRYGADLGLGAELIRSFFETLDADLLAIGDGRS